MPEFMAFSKGALPGAALSHVQRNRLAERAKLFIGETGSSLPEPTGSRARPTVNAAKVFYEFWNTGNAALPKSALWPSFTDRVLPFRERIAHWFKSCHPNH